MRKYDVFRIKSVFCMILLYYLLYTIATTNVYQLSPKEQHFFLGG